MDIPLAALAALGGYLLLAYVVVDRCMIMPISRERMVAMRHFLHGQAEGGRREDVYFLGSSVLLEGVDCGVVDAGLGGRRHSYNLAWTGGIPSQWLLVAPLVKATRPSTAVCCVDLPGVFSPDPIPEDVLAIAGWWDFLGPEELRRFEGILTDGERRTLSAPGWRHLATFRSFPPGALDSYLREVSRPSLRYEGYATNFKAPWVRRKKVSPGAKERAIGVRRRVLNRRSAHDMSRCLRSVEAIIEYVADANCRVLIVLTPVNPDLSHTLEKDLVSLAAEALSELAQRTGAVFVDHSGLLQADHFSDAAHPFKTGREIWSRQLGRSIAELSADTD